MSGAKNQNDYLKQLEIELMKLNILGREEILRDYLEHFQSARQQGRSDEEIIQKLGSPSTLARAFEAEQSLRPSPLQTRSRGPQFLAATFRVLLLTPFNFFVLIGPVLLTFLFLVVGWSLSAVFALISFVAVVASLIATPAFIIHFWATGAVIFGALSLLFFSLLTLIVMTALSRLILNLFANYLRWNLNFVLQKA